MKNKKINKNAGSIRSIHIIKENFDDVIVSNIDIKVRTTCQELGIIHQVKGKYVMSDKNS